MSQPWGIIQARMSSNRLPGKVLQEVDGVPLLGHLLERVKRASSLANIVVGTSTEASDVPILDYCRRQQILCFRGALQDVAGRFVDIVEHFNIQSFVRINGDSPLLDPALIDQAVQLFDSAEYDVVTNILQRSYPKGQSVEVVRGAALRQAYPQMNASEKEHVTPFFYGHTAQFRILNFAAPGGNFSTLNLSIDTPEDLKCFETLLKTAGPSRDSLGWQDWLRLYREAGKPVQHS